MFSDSLLALLDLKRATNKDSEERKKIVKQIAQKFKSSVQWTQDWNTMATPLYGVEFQSLPKGIDKVLNGTFDPKMFSVVSYGEVGNVTQRAYAILERVQKNDTNKTYYDVNVKKFYWI